MVSTTSTRPNPARVRGVLTPSLDELRGWLGSNPSAAKTIPIYREIMADVETPVSAFLKIKGSGSGFILESVEGGERIARYSFIGAGPITEITMEHGVATLATGEEVTSAPYSDPLRVLEDVIAPYRGEGPAGLPLPRFVGGLVGYLSYETIRAFEPRVGAAKGPGLGLPDSRFMLVDSLLVIDHVERTIKAVSHLRLDESATLDDAYAAAAARVDDLVAKLRAPLPPMPIGEAPVVSAAVDRSHSNTSPERYREMIEAAKEYIKAGDRHRTGSRRKITG